MKIVLPAIRVAAYIGVVYMSAIYLKKDDALNLSFGLIFSYAACNVALQVLTDSRFVYRYIMEYVDNNTMSYICLFKIINAAIALGSVAFNGWSSCEALKNKGELLDDSWNSVASTTKGNIAIALSALSGSSWIAQSVFVADVVCLCVSEALFNYAEHVRNEIFNRFSQDNQWVNELKERGPETLGWAKTD